MDTIERTVDQKLRILMMGCLLQVEPDNYSKHLCFPNGAVFNVAYASAVKRIPWENPHIAYDL